MQGQRVLLQNIDNRWVMFEVKKWASLTTAEQMMLTFGLVTIHNLTLPMGMGLSHCDPGPIPPSLDVSVVSLRFGDFRICDNWLLNHLLFHDRSYLTCIQPSQQAGDRQQQE
jgi:hypothetical protein